MPNGSYDVAIVGAGHTGLIAAAYLARAGRRVVVLEQRDRPGGAVGTDEIAPGFLVPACHPTADLLHPSIVDDLGLCDHGLVLLPGRSGTYLATRGAGGLCLARNGERIVAAPELSPADGSALATFDRFLARVAAALEPALTAPLPDVERRKLTDIVDLLRLGWRLRGLGRADAAEAMRFLPMCVQDVLDERLRNSALKAALAGPALRASWLGPRSPGSAYGLLHHHPAWTAGLAAPPVFVQGGPAGLAESLANAAARAGAHVRTSARVERILVADGAVTAVVLDGGDEVHAPVVASSIDPRRTLLDLVEPLWLEPEFTTALRNVRGRGTVAIVRFALDRVPAFGGAPDHALTGRIQIGESLDDLERAFDAVKYGAVSAAPTIECYVPSAVDPSSAPAGKHVMIAWVQYAPHTLHAGSWGGARAGLEETVTQSLDAHAPGFSSTIVARDSVTPADLETRFGMSQGCLYHVELALDQLFYLRPVPGWYRYRMPIRGLYLCGSGTHGGGGVTGLPGRNAARQILADWKPR